MHSPSIRCRVIVGLEEQGRGRWKSRQLMIAAAARADADGSPRAAAAQAPLFLLKTTTPSTDSETAACTLKHTHPHPIKPVTQDVAPNRNDARPPAARAAGTLFIFLWLPLSLSLSTDQSIARSPVPSLLLSSTNPQAAYTRNEGAMALSLTRGIR